MIKQLSGQNYFNYYGHDLGIVPGIRFSSLSALACLAAGSISSHLHLDSDILMMNYGLLSKRLPTIQKNILLNCQLEEQPQSAT